ncbi:hypothetical protein T492DRAFT_112702 [Pavlovales sp. CCMP2436]|nr:hypothetical protein T492DRAFT_112702 [Pavlovales sp. CCMP2436]
MYSRVTRKAAHALPSLCGNRMRHCASPDCRSGVPFFSSFLELPPMSWGAGLSLLTFRIPSIYHCLCLPKCLLQHPPPPPPPPPPFLPVENITYGILFNKHDLNIFLSFTNSCSICRPQYIARFFHLLLLHLKFPASLSLLWVSICPWTGL